MSEAPYNQQIITQYLLGSISESETERLDQLSITDEEFASALRTAENDLVDAYVHGELIDPALAQFKTHYLASPLRQEKVRFAEALQEFGSRAKVTETVVPEPVVKAESETPFKKRGWFSIFVSQPAFQWGFAVAALVVVASVSWLVYQNLRLRNQIAETQQQAAELSRREAELNKQLEQQRSSTLRPNEELARVQLERERLEQQLKGLGEQVEPAARVASFLLTPQMRGTGRNETVTIPAKTVTVAMRLQLEPNDFNEYFVTLSDKSGNRTFWRSRKLRAIGSTGNLFLNVSFRADLLKTDDYVLQVEGISRQGSSERVGDYPFRVVR